MMFDIPHRTLRAVAAVLTGRGGQHRYGRDPRRLRAGRGAAPGRAAVRTRCRRGAGPGLAGSRSLMGPAS